MEQLLLQRGEALEHYKVGPVLLQSGAALMYHNVGQMLLQSGATFLNYKAVQVVLVTDNLSLEISKKLKFCFNYKNGEITSPRQKHLPHLSLVRNNPLEVFLDLETVFVKLLEIF